MAVCGAVIKNGTGGNVSIGAGVPGVAKSYTLQLLPPQHDKAKSSILVNQDVLGLPSLHDDSFSLAASLPQCGTRGRCVNEQGA